MRKQKMIARIYELLEINMHSIAVYQMGIFVWQNRPFIFFTVNFLCV